MTLLKRVVEEYTGEVVKRMKSHPDPDFGFPDVWAVRAWLVGYEGQVDLLVILSSANVEECAEQVEEVEWDEWPPRQATSRNVFNL